MIKNLTTKNLYDLFHQIALNHNQITGYGTGDIYRVNEKENLQHPTLWVDLYQADLSYNLLNVNARIYVFDIPDQADDAENDVHSDTLMMLNDIVIILRQHYEIVNEEFNSSANFFKHDFNDRVAGWMIELELEIPRTYGECDISVQNLQPFPGIEGGDIIYDAPMNEFILKSNSKYWKVTISNEGNLLTQEITI